jgi:hypothetical protein
MNEQENSPCSQTGGTERRVNQSLRDRYRVAFEFFQALTKSVSARPIQLFEVLPSWIGNLKSIGQVSSLAKGIQRYGFSVLKLTNCFRYHPVELWIQTEFEIFNQLFQLNVRRFDRLKRMGR